MSKHLSEILKPRIGAVSLIFPLLACQEGSETQTPELSHVITPAGTPRYSFGETCRASQRVIARLLAWDGERLISTRRTPFPRLTVLAPAR